jgi:hypothetical protein
MIVNNNIPSKERDNVGITKQYNMQSHIAFMRNSNSMQLDLKNNI